MSSIKEDLQIEFDGLRYEIRVANKNIADFSKRHFNSTRENALVFCLQRAVELAQGCDRTAEARLLAPVYVLTGGLFESLVWVCWITFSNENAKAFIKATDNELKRVARKSLTNGHAKVRDKVTREDKTQELLKSAWAKDIERRIKIEEAAKVVGLEKLYIRVYSFLSMHAHGTTFGLTLRGNVDEKLTSVLALANVLMACINLVVKNWIVARKQTAASDIYDILKL